MEKMSGVLIWKESRAPHQRCLEYLEGNDNSRTKFRIVIANIGPREERQTKQRIVSAEKICYLDRRPSMMVDLHRSIGIKVTVYQT